MLHDILARIPCQSSLAGVWVKATVVISRKTSYMMSKRLVVKLAVAIITLGAVTLLQGCGDEDDEVGYSFVWVSSGFMPASGTSPAEIQVSGTW